MRVKLPINKIKFQLVNFPIQISFIFAFAMKLFVKNIESSINEFILEGLFARFGEVLSTKIVYDRITYESKGFAFIEMAKKEDALKAMETLNDKELKGLKLIVKEAEERR